MNIFMVGAIWGLFVVAAWAFKHAAPYGTSWGLLAAFVGAALGFFLVGPLAGAALLMPFEAAARLYRYHKTGHWIEPAEKENERSGKAEHLCVPTQSIFPDFLSTRLGPVPRKGEMKSEFLLRLSWFSIVSFLFLSALILLGFHFDDRSGYLDRRPVFAGVFLFAMPLFAGVGLLGGIFSAAKAVWLRVRGRDGICNN